MLFHYTGVSFLQFFFRLLGTCSCAGETDAFKEGHIGGVTSVDISCSQMPGDFCFCEVPSEAPPFLAFLYPGCSPD